jgi:hypothetical protein
MCFNRPNSRSTAGAAPVEAAPFVSTARDAKVALFLALTERDVLVSFDNKMPTRHRPDLIRRKSTVAYIDSKAPRAGRNREQYTREVIHKWAHRMANQAPGTLYKYRLNGRTLIKL